MNVRCLAYRALDAFRHTPIAQWVFYKGQKVRTVTPQKTVIGRVIAKPTNADDGDVTFGITLENGDFRHCEVTPCATAAVKQIAKGLVLGQIVEVSGQERFDPGHLFGPSQGWLEIHPVEAIQTKET